eukprot:g2912.t1
MTMRRSSLGSSSWTLTGWGAARIAVLSMIIGICTRWWVTASFPHVLEVVLFACFALLIFRAERMVEMAEVESMLEVREKMGKSGKGNVDDDKAGAVKKGNTGERVVEDLPMTILSSKHYLEARFAVHPTIASELGALTDLAIRDFVREWFSKCSDDNAFVNDVKTIALDIVGTLSKHLTRLKTVSFIAGDVTEVFRHHLLWYAEIRRRVHSQQPSLDGDELRQQIEQGFLDEGQLHCGCTESGDVSTEYLRHVTGQLLARVMDSRDHGSNVVRHLLQEVIASVILKSSMEAVDPSLVNWLILLLIEKMQGDEETDGKKKDAKKKGAKSAREGASHSTSSTSSISAAGPEGTSGSTEAMDLGWRYFAGVLSRPRAELLLRGKPAGTFLFRRPPRVHILEGQVLNGDAELVLSTTVHRKATSPKKMPQICHFPIAFDGRQYSCAQQRIEAESLAGLIRLVCGGALSVGLHFKDDSTDIIPEPEVVPWATAEEKAVFDLISAKMATEITEEEIRLADEQEENDADAVEARLGQAPKHDSPNAILQRQRTLQGHRRPSYVKEGGKRAALGRLRRRSMSIDGGSVRGATRDVQKGVLLEELENVVHACSTRGLESETPVSPLKNGDPDTRRLVGAIEGVLFHGLRSRIGTNANMQRQTTGYWDFVKQIGDILPEASMITKLVHQLRNPSAAVLESFWSEGEAGPGDEDGTVTHDSSGPLAKALGRGRSWLVLVLNKNLTSAYLETLISDQDLTRRFYDSHSILRDSKSSSLFMRHLSKLEGVQFDISMDALWTPLTVAGSEPQVEASQKQPSENDPLPNNKVAQHDDKEELPHEGSTGSTASAVFTAAVSISSNTNSSASNEKNTSDAINVTGSRSEGGASPSPKEAGGVQKSKKKVKRKKTLSSRFSGGNSKEPRMFSLNLFGGKAKNTEASLSPNSSPTKQQPRGKAMREKKTRKGESNAEEGSPADEDVGGHPTTTYANAKRAASASIGQSSKLSETLSLIGVHVDTQTNHAKVERQVCRFVRALCADQDEEVTYSKLKLSIIAEFGAEIFEAHKDAIELQLDTYYSNVFQLSQKMAASVSSSPERSPPATPPRPTGGSGQGNESGDERADDEGEQANLESTEDSKDVPQKSQQPPTLPASSAAAGALFLPEENHHQLRDIVAREAAAKALSRNVPGNDQWCTAVDKVSGKMYYFHRLTREVSWTPPVRIKEAPGIPSMVRGGSNGTSTKPLVKIRAEVTNAKRNSRRMQETSFVEYSIQVQVTVLRTKKAHSWVVRRRYREFHALHSKMKLQLERINVKLPSKRHFTLWGKQSREFVEQRRAGLDTYLSQLLSLPGAISRTDSLLLFLRLDEKMPGVFGEIQGLQRAHGAMPVHRGSHGSHAGAKSAVGKRYERGTTSAGIQQHVQPKAVSMEAGKSSSSRLDVERLSLGNTENIRLSTLVEMRQDERNIFNLVAEVFELDHLSLVRRNMIKVLRGLVQFWFQGMVSTILGESFQEVTKTAQIAYILEVLRSKFWPGGTWSEEPAATMSPEETKAEREGALKALLGAVPESFATLLARDTCNEGVRKVHGMLQCSMIVKSIVLTIIDMLLLRLYPDIAVEGLHQIDRF